MKCARCRDTYWCARRTTIAPGTARTSAGAAPRGCRARRAMSRTPTISRGCLPDFSATKASMTNDPGRIGMRIEVARMRITEAGRRGAPVKNGGGGRRG
jgi:hypothetical protein